MSAREGLPEGLVDVGPSGAVERCGCGGMGIKTLEAQCASLFEPPRPGKVVRFKSVFGRGCSRSKEECGGSGDEEEEVVPPREAVKVRPRETVLVPAADETVRSTLKPWLRDAWQIRGEISSITEETDEDTAAEILKDVFDNAAGARSAAKHLHSRFFNRLEKKFSGDPSLGLLDPEERAFAATFAVTLEEKLKSLKLKLDQELFLGPEVVVPGVGEPLCAVDAVKTLEVVKDVMLGVLEVTEVVDQEASGSGSFVGLTEIPVDCRHCARVAALFAACQKYIRIRWLSMKSPSLTNLLNSISQCKLVWPREEESGVLMQPPPWKEDLMLLMEFAAKGICDVRSYGLLGWLYYTDGSLKLTVDGHLAGSLCENVFSPGSHMDKTDAMHLVYGLQQAAVSHGKLSSPPRAYDLHPDLNSVTVYPGCALKPFCLRMSADDCHGRLRRSALRDEHGMLFILGKGFVIILNFKTSNACIVNRHGQVLEGASKDAGSPIAVHELAENGMIEGEMELDRSQAVQQVRAARDASAAQGKDPGELEEWEGTAMVAAATWLRSTHLLRVGNSWYIRQNPRWKRIWKLVVRLVREHRLTGISVLSVGVTWNTVVVRDAKIIKLLCDKMLAATRTARKGWHEVPGSKDIEGIVRATAEVALHLDDNVLRLCRSTIEGSIAQAQGIILSVYGGFSSWRHLYTQEQRCQDTMSVGFDYVAKDPHQLGGRSLMKMESHDGYYIKLRNDAGLLRQRWYKLRNAPDSPILDLDGQFKEGNNLTEQEHRSADVFDATNRIVSIGDGTLLV